MFVGIFYKMRLKYKTEKFPRKVETNRDPQIHKIISTVENIKLDEIELPPNNFRCFLYYVLLLF